MEKPENLTNKQWAFVLEYPKDWNATQAAKRAGYSENTAGSIGTENLSKPAIRAALSQAFKDAAMETEELFAGVANIARNEKEEVRDRLRAYEMIGRGHAAFTDKVKQDTDLNITIKFEDVE
jgi:phage terminase small subunit